MTPIEQHLKDSIGEIKANLQTLQLKLEECTEQVKNLQTINAELSTKLEKEAAARDELEQYSRRDNLLITGIPASMAERAAAGQGTQPNLNAESSDVTTTKVISFCEDVLHVSIDANDISIAHRCKMRRGSKVPPVLVRFTRRSKRDEVFRAKSALKAYNEQRPMDERAYINEDLTENNNKLLGIARKAVKDHKLESAWSFNCRIFVKTAGLNGSRHSITSLQRLNDIIV